MAEEDPVRKIVERQFRIYEERTDRIDKDTAARLFFVMFDARDFDPRFEAVRRDVQALDPELLVFMRREGGEDILFVTPRPHGGPVRNRTNVLLLVLTLITTTTAGAVFWEGFAFAGREWRWGALWDPVNLGMGLLTFALPLMFILGVHETAHFFAARRHGLRATLPYFIPVPPILFFPIGTFGAFIRLRDPLPDRKALFDVGASGPLAGFVVAVPLLIIGTLLTASSAVAVPDLGRPTIEAEGFGLDMDDPGATLLTLSSPTQGGHVFAVTSPEDDWQVTFVARVTTDDGVQEDRQTFSLAEGQRHLGVVRVPVGATAAEVAVEWDDGLVRFGDPLLVMALEGVVQSGDHLTHPTYFAAWVGVLVTGMNLLPAGQLDGGHVARALLGDRVRYAGLASLGLLMFLAFRFSPWLILALFLVLTGVHHPPPLNDRTPLDAKRKVVAALVIIVFAVTFVPVPIHA